MTRAKQFCTCLALESDYIASKPYDLIIFVDEMFPIEDNGNRCLDEKYQKWVFEFLKGEIHGAWERFGVPTIDVRGSTEERVEMILRKLF
jgi:nicotinamide riboside kinase